MRHEPRLQADVRIAHVAFEFGLRDERRDRVDHDDINGVGTHEHFGDVERLFAGIRLRNEEAIEIDAEALCVRGIESVLDIDEGRRAAQLLRLGDHMEREGRLTARLRPVNLDDAAARKTTDPERQIERDRSRRDDVHMHALGEVAHLHDGALAELPFDLCERVTERYRFVVRHVMSAPSMSAMSDSYESMVSGESATIVAQWFAFRPRIRTMRR